MKSSMRTERRVYRNRGPAHKKKPKYRKSLAYVFAVCLCLIVAGVCAYFHKPQSVARKSPASDRVVAGIGAPPFGELTRGASKVLAVTKAKLQFESRDNQDIIRVIVEKDVNLGDRIVYAYQWTKNGEPFGGNNDAASGFKRGDRIAVKVTPFDGDVAGQPGVFTMEVKNTTSISAEGKQLKYDGKVLSYQVKGTDPNGDALSYALVDAPGGMTIDSASGILNWQIKEGDQGSHTVKVRITSSKGSEVVFPLKIDLDKAASRVD
ncbi:MAG TPA: Ig domain-containing protein [Syntrophorhabdaceae bacterium]|nr:Ig domain-containing protein [Syntrophorhabdaceae bacterium]